jgi:hypothetical protein
VLGTVVALIGMQKSKVLGMPSKIGKARQNATLKPGTDKAKSDLFW